MEEQTKDIITETILQVNKKRKELITGWIKIFSWIFLVLGIIAPFLLIGGILGNDVELSLYGLETNQPLSFIGLSVITLFLLKGFTAYSLLKEKDWAIVLALIDAVIGIIICMLIMSLPMVGNAKVNFRMELIALIPYLVKMLKIKSDWELRGQIVL
jgi:hypothetical protein